MDQHRKGEIAIAVLKYRLGEEGIRLNDGTRRRLGNIAKKTGVPKTELTEFASVILEEMKEQFLLPIPKESSKD